MFNICGKPLAFTLLIAQLTNMALAQGNCSPATFQNLSLFGGKVLHVETQVHSNYSVQVVDGQNHIAKNVTNLDACEVVVTWTHPGYDDSINAILWLPSAATWTGRFMGAGGGGWTTGVEDNTTLPWAASEGFAVVTTYGGHGQFAGPEEWALLSPGNVNWPLFQDFASTSLDDATTLGKQVVQAFYGKPASYSYWNGCSTGGRQGHMMAQRYPEQYDGILATAPGYHWAQIFMEFFWAHAVMNDLGQYPAPCEIEAIHIATIRACDALDGLEDGILLSSENCTFDPSTLVGQQHICPSTNGTATITAAAATVAKATWQGATSPSGESLWYGLDKSARLVNHAGTVCTNGTCTSAPVILPIQWMKYFLARDPTFDTTKVNTTSFDALFRQGVNQYDSIIGTADPDLSYFRKAGGKLISWHGLADSALGPKYTEDYVRKVYERDPKASEFYRYFEAPGVDHCGLGTEGFYPGDALKSLIDWVEKGVVPETLEGKTRGLGSTRSAELCLWPKKMVYLGGGADKASSFGCK